MLAEENHSCLRRQSHDVAMNRAVWSPASPRCRALCVCGMNTGVQTLLEKLPGLSWKTTVPVSHTQTQCSDMREGHTLKWTTASTFFFFFSKHFHYPPSLELSKPAETKCLVLILTCSRQRGPLYP